MAIHLITNNNQLAYKNELIKLHRARKEVFVDELGWKLDIEDGLEYDEYDDDRAMQVVGFDFQEDVAMSVRFRPTDDRAMLTDHFSHVLSDPHAVITGPEIWEVSRGFCREMGRKHHNLLRKAACMLAPLEVARAAGVNAFVGFSDVRVINFFLNIGWKLEFLGDAVPYGEGDGIAYKVEVSDEAIDHMRKMWGLPKPSYLYLQPEQLDGMNPLVYAAELAKSDSELAQLMPQQDTLATPRRQQAHHYDRYANNRRTKALARLQKSRQTINYGEGISS